MSVFALDSQAFADWLNSKPSYDYVIDVLKKEVEDFFADVINNGKYSRWQYTDDSGHKQVVRDKAEQLYNAARNVLRSSSNKLSAISPLIQQIADMLNRALEENHYTNGLPAKFGRAKIRLQKVADKFSTLQVHAMSHEDNLGPEYKYDISLGGPELALLSTLHSGMDNIYALTSRLYAYGKTKASEAEIDDVIDALDGVVNDVYPDVSKDEKVLARGVIRKLTHALGSDAHVAVTVPATELYLKALSDVFNDLYDSLFGQYASYTIEDPGQLESSLASARARIKSFVRKKGSGLSQGDLERLNEDAILFFNEFSAARRKAGVFIEKRQRGYREIVRRSIEALRRILAADAETPEKAPLRQPNRPPFRDIGPIGGQVTTRSGKGETMALPPKIQYQGRKYVLAENPAHTEQSVVDSGNARKNLEDHFPGRSPATEYKYLDETNAPSGKSDAVTDTKEMNKRREDAMKGKDDRNQEDLNSNAPNKIKYGGITYIRADTLLPDKIKYAGREYVRLGTGDAGEYLDHWKPGDEKSTGKKLQNYFNMSSSKDDVSEYMVNRDVDFKKENEGIDPTSSEPGPEKGVKDNLPNEYMDKEKVRGMPRLDSDDDRVPKAAAAQPPRIRHAGHVYIKVSDEEAQQIIAAKKKKSPGVGKTGWDWKDLPKGWTKKSTKKYWKDVGGTVAKCVRDVKKSKKEGSKKHKGISDPGAFCASLADLIEGPEWRHKPRKKSKKSKR